MPYRYSPEGIPGLYFSSPERIIKAELTNHRIFDITKGRTTYSYNVKLTNMLDVTNPQIRSNLGVSLNSLLTSRDYSITQQIGSYAYKNGYNGIIVPSARADGDINIILFNTEEVGYVGNKAK